MVRNRFMLGIALLRIFISLNQSGDFRQLVKLSAKALKFREAETAVHEIFF